MADGTGAVFLSYASQDAEAARRICEALRTGGIQVWFDESERRRGQSSANALFGSLQVVTAGRLGFSPVLIAAANSIGGVMGKMISIQTIAVAAAATGLTVNEQARLFRFTLRHSLLLASVVGIEVLFYSYVLHAQ